jgi:hypothetical protein
MSQAAQLDMTFLPHLPRKSVAQDVRDDYNAWKRDQENLGGLMPTVLARVILGVSRQRLHEMLEQGHMRYVTHQGHVYIAGDDIKERLAQKRDGRISKGGRPRKTS